jgi:hypothetical protein
LHSNLLQTHRAALEYYYLLPGCSVELLGIDEQHANVLPHAGAWPLQPFETVRLPNQCAELVDAIASSTEL